MKLRTLFLLALGSAAFVMPGYSQDNSRGTGIDATARRPVPTPIPLTPPGFPTRMVPRYDTNTPPINPNGRAGTINQIQPTIQGGSETNPGRINNPRGVNDRPGAVNNPGTVNGSGTLNRGGTLNSTGGRSTGTTGGGAGAPGSTGTGTTGTGTTGGAGTSGGISR